MVPGAAVSGQDYVGSYYAATPPAAPRHAALSGDVDCDVCVVGGGIAGCTAALQLAERGFRVVLLEAERIGWGASGRSGAQALPGLAAGEEKTEALIGRGDPGLIDGLGPFGAVTVVVVNAERGAVALHVTASEPAAVRV